MKTAMQNLLLEVDNLVKIGIFTEENAQRIRNYVEHIGVREEATNIKNAWVHAIYSSVLDKEMTAEKYFSETYK